MASESAKLFQSQPPISVLSMIAASDTTEANEDRLAAAMEIFRDESEFDESFDGFAEETDDDDDE